ncbi:hypothetical protein JOC26_001294 [Sporohalobacter salinus]|nr:hypothetical protein [Sporohalobacter salinus]
MYYRYLSILKSLMSIALLLLIVVSLVRGDTIYSGIMFFVIGFMDYIDEKPSNNIVSKIINSYHFDFIMGILLILVSLY